MNQLIRDKVRSFSAGSIIEEAEFRGELTLVIRKEDIVRIGRFLRDDPELCFDLLSDLCGVDMYRPEGRFEVVYHLYSIRNKCYVRLKVRVDGDQPVVDTVCSVWPGANWHERETFDMFGISFTGHPDLRRMYMPEEYEHHPLRKDFPLLGIPDAIPLPRK